MKEYEVIKNYRRDDALRASFNALAGKTFGIDFEDWYQNGYWTDAYNPHSIVIDGKIAANVSVNHTDFVWSTSMTKRSITERSEPWSRFPWRGKKTGTRWKGQ